MASIDCDKRFCYILCIDLGLVVELQIVLLFVCVRICVYVCVSVCLQRSMRTSLVLRTRHRRRPRHCPHYTSAAVNFILLSIALHAVMSSSHRLNGHPCPPNPARPGQSDQIGRPGGLATVASPRPSRRLSVSCFLLTEARLATTS